MLSSRKFWIPFLISLPIGGFGILWVMMAAFAGGAHARGGNSGGLGTMLFPFASILDNWPGGGPFVLTAIVFLLQWPAYGAVAGYGNFHDKIKPFLLGIAIVHILALFMATFGGR